MAVLQMQRIFICALKKNRKQILELLQRRGVIEICDTIPEDSVFRKTDVSKLKSSFEKNVSIAKEASEILASYSTEKQSMLSALQGRSEITTETYDAFSSRYESTVRVAHRINALNKEIVETNAEILKLHTQMEILTPWMGLDIPMNFTGTKQTASFIGTLPHMWTLEMIYEKLANDMPFNVDIISTSKDQTCIFVLCKKDKANSVYETLRSMEFSLPSISFSKAPSEQLDDLNQQLGVAHNAIKKAEEEIKSYHEQKEDLLFLQDYDTMRADKYDVIGHLLQSKNVFVMTGYIPEKYANTLVEELNSTFELSVELEQPSPKDNVPVLLENNGFSRPLEGIVAAYSPPGKGEIDPTFMMSLFYYVLFGLMLSDVGYGGIIALACAVLLFKFRKTIEAPMKNTLKMYLYCGISTIFWGIMFGSYFGDIVAVVSETYFGRQIVVPPLWFVPMGQPMRMLTFSMLIGIIHLFAGLFMRLYQLLKVKDIKAIFYDVVFWLVLLSSSIVLLLSMDMIIDILGVNFKVPSAIASVAGYIAIAAAIGIVLTNGRESKNPFKRFLKGLYALYGISGYLSDVLSYSRLLALGLATGVIGTVINKMASMVGGGFIGPVLFMVIFVVGHTLNLAINALGAYVHTNRLQYVEFFGKFYEGGGRLFNPFTTKTKYYKIKEKIKNG